MGDFSAGWSLGRFADLLWQHVPEARPAIAEIACRELCEAARYDRVLRRPGDYALADAVGVILVHALRAGPAGVDVARRCTDALRLVAQELEPRYRDVVRRTVLAQIRAGGLVDDLNGFDPGLTALFVQRSG